MDTDANYRQTKLSLDELTETFYGLFSNKGGQIPNLAGIYELFIPKGLIIKNLAPEPEVYDLEKFIKPREALLNGGILTEFEEYEVSEKTEIFGRVAQRFSRYHKSGILSGKAFETDGAKSIAFVLTSDGWKMSFVAWDDESI